MTKHGLLSKEALAQRSSSTIASIDLYVSLGLLFPIESHDGIFFTSQALVRIEIIEKGKRLGFSLVEIKRLIEAYDGMNPFVDGVKVL